MSAETVSAGPTESAGKPPLLVICGPTATGKTAAAIRAAQFLGGEIISADAVQIYRYLDIGSAKPSAAERAAAPHHLLDLIEPTERYSAARFAAEALRSVAEIRARGALPIVAGGSGLYLKALLYGLAEAPAADAAVRARLHGEAAAQGAPRLHARLAEVDPEVAARLDPNDEIRIVRALEVYELTGRPLGEHHRRHGFREMRFDALLWAIDPGPAILAERIAVRVQRMFEAGFVDEVRALLARGLAADCPGLSTVGYRDVVRHLAGEIDLDEATRRIARDHRRYAKRQRTWFRGMERVRWFEDAAELPLGEARAYWSPSADA